jgi:hypothetical protein
MAILNIDRHIVTDMVGLQKKKEEMAMVADRSWQKIMFYDAQIKAFCKDNDCKNAEEARQKKTEAIKIADRAWKRLMSLDSESKGLLMHIVNRIIEVDTGKGKEVGSLG